MLQLCAKCCIHVIITHANTLSFSAQKSKCLVVLPRARRFLAPLVHDCDFRIGGARMEIVSSYFHLGHVITNSLDDGPDIVNRQNSFIGQVNTMLCFFR